MPIFFILLTIIQHAYALTIKGHMAIVSSDPGNVGGALGVITLEDVIEELIGEVNILSNQPTSVINNFTFL